MIMIFWRGKAENNDQSQHPATTTITTMSDRPKRARKTPSRYDGVHKQVSIPPLTAVTEVTSSETTMTVVAAPPALENHSNGISAAPGISVYSDIPATAVAESRSRALVVNEIAKKGNSDITVGVTIPTGEEITLLENKNKKNPSRKVRTPVEFLTQLVFDFENQGHPSAKVDLLSSSATVKTGENRYRYGRNPFCVGIMDKFSIDESEGVAKIVCAHCAKQWSLEDFDKVTRGIGVLLLGNHALFCSESGLSWTKDMDLFLWMVDVRLKIMPSEKADIGGRSTVGMLLCPLRSHRDGSDKKIHRFTLMELEEFDEICAELELPHRDAHLMQWLDEAESKKLILKLRRILVKGESFKSMTNDHWKYLCEMGYHQVIPEETQQACGYVQQQLPSSRIWRSDIDLFLWMWDARFKIIPSEQANIGVEGRLVCTLPLRSRRDGSDVKIRNYTLMELEEFDEICAELELPHRDAHLMLWLDKVESKNLSDKMIKIIRGKIKGVTDAQWCYLCEMGFDKVISQEIQYACGYLQYNEDENLKIAAIPSASMSMLPSTDTEMPELPDTSDLYPHDSDWAPMLNMSPPTVGDWDPMTSEWSPMITDWSPTIPTDALQVKKMAPSQIEEGVSLQSTSDPNAQSNSDIAEV
eukprot:scaffold162190_cov40-Cyclotella_meneghiniana.AAC.2